MGHWHAPLANLLDTLALKYDLKIQTRIDKMLKMLQDKKGYDTLMPYRHAYNNIMQKYQ